MTRLCFQEAEEIRSLWADGEKVSGLADRFGLSRRSIYLIVNGHTHNRPRPTELERFFSKIEIVDGHWIWTGAKNNLGYGVFRSADGSSYAHRFAYEFLVGPIPSNKEIDHICRIPQCVMPDHLEPVSHRENVMRGISPAVVHAMKTHCKRGHKLSGHNLRTRKSGGRDCRACANARNKKYRDGLKA